jgi:tetratricopeptide (TPR) repeat protein
LRAVLRTAPGNVVAISALGTLLQSVGRVRESARFSILSAELDPMSPIYQFRKTFGLWCTGRLEEADRTIDRALRLWPRHPALWNTRALLFALTDRPHAALAMMDDSEGLPRGMPEAAVSNWRSSLKALATRARADIEAAMAGTIDRLARSPAVAVNGICIATRLGDLDSAFTMADAYLLRRGPHVGVLRSGPDQLPLTDQRWQMTMMLFIPATAAMRSDPRFMPLCRDMGMADYWSASRTQPDFLAGPAPAT